MKLSLLSKYRAQLMGVAILLVSLFHCSVEHASEAFDLICFSGDMGVDIFFWVSGIGMYYAYQKNPTWKEFYIKRILRIIPAWCIVNLIVLFSTYTISNMDWVEFFKYMTGISFWLDGNLYFWYVPAIFCFYLLTPLFMKCYKENKKKAYFGIGIIWVLLIGIVVIMRKANYFIFLLRWPLFFLGVLFGEWSFKQVECKKKNILTCGIVFAVFFTLLEILKINLERPFVRYEYKYILYIFLSISLCILVAYFMDRGKYEFPILKFLGSITLEIYLLHEFLLRKITEHIGYVPFDSLGILFNILVFIGTVLIAWMFHKILDNIFK